ncbi:hypothetical protein QJS66_18715 [Kocuria rhizophila]|nr:hypothetical protein QJS66_18715 [Kocuria rhizophila]
MHAVIPPVSTGETLLSIRFRRRSGCPWWTSWPPARLTSSSRTCSPTPWRPAPT